MLLPPLLEFEKVSSKESEQFWETLDLSCLWCSSGHPQEAQSLQLALKLPSHLLWITMAITESKQIQQVTQAKDLTLNLWGFVGTTLETYKIYNGDEYSAHGVFKCFTAELLFYINFYGWLKKTCSNSSIFCYILYNIATNYWHGGMYRKKDIGSWKIRNDFTTIKVSPAYQQGNSSWHGERKLDCSVLNHKFHMMTKPKNKKIKQTSSKGCVQDVADIYMTWRLFYSYFHTISYEIIE